MGRQGREPAEDVKRRIVHACRAAGLKVATARMYLQKAHRGRLLFVAASPVDWQHVHPLITVFAFVRMDGTWSGDVDIRCSTAESDPVMNFWDTLVMRGRNAVPAAELAGELRRTIEERDQVMAAIKLGVAGPYHFEGTCWEIPDLVI